jgi:hypothetical protein
MAVLEATGNIIRHASICEADATSVLQQQGHNLKSNEGARSYK